MMSLLIAQRVIIGRVEFEVIPKKLKPLVYADLKDCGMEFLAGDYVPPTK